MSGPLIALVGRPNVGKSTIFNALTRTRDALVADQPGLTRDRQYGEGRVGDLPYSVLDTGGLSGDDNQMDVLIAEQAWIAAEEADLIFFIVDGRAGVTAFDDNIAARLRRMKKPVIVVVNKAEGISPEIIVSDFYSLGLGEPVAISASHNQGLYDLLLSAYEKVEFPAEKHEKEIQDDIIRLAVFGRPNAGKSTLINQMLGEERVLASEVAGTTRDSIEIPFTAFDREFILIDTAGIRRRSRVTDLVEKFSVIKSLDALEKANVIVFVFDAKEGLSDQDATLLGAVLEAGKGLILAVNKWDSLDEDEKSWIQQDFAVRFAFIDFTQPLFISALNGQGVLQVVREAISVFDQSMREFSTNELSNILEYAVHAHQPPMDKGYAPKLRYAHQGGKNPLKIIVHGNRTQYVKDSYTRYLCNMFRDQLKIEGTPVRVLYRTNENPYANRPGKTSEIRGSAKRKRKLERAKEK